MKKFSISILISGTIIFFIGVTNIFDVIYRRELALIYFGGVVAVIGIILTAISINKSQK